MILLSDFGRIFEFEYRMVVEMGFELELSLD